MSNIDWCETMSKHLPKYETDVKPLAFALVRDFM